MLKSIILFYVFILMQLNTALIRGHQTHYEDKTYPLTDKNYEKIGRIQILDELLSEDYYLRAISFSTTDKTNVYKEILSDALERIQSLFYENKIDEALLNEAKYYRNVIENVKKYTSKWLTEEVQQLTIQTNEKQHDIQARKRRNIAEYIYFGAGDYGVELVLAGKDTSLDGWRETKPQHIQQYSSSNKIEL